MIKGTLKKIGFGLIFLIPLINIILYFYQTQPPKVIGLTKDYVLEINYTTQCITSSTDPVQMLNCIGISSPPLNHNHSISINESDCANVVTFHMDFPGNGPRGASSQHATFFLILSSLFNDNKLVILRRKGFFWGRDSFVEEFGYEPKLYLMSDIYNYELVSMFLRRMGYLIVLEEDYRGPCNRNSIAYDYSRHPATNPQVMAHTALSILFFNEKILKIAHYIIKHLGPGYVGLHLRWEYDYCKAGKGYQEHILHALNEHPDYQFLKNTTVFVGNGLWTRISNYSQLPQSLLLKEQVYSNFSQQRFLNRFSHHFGRIITKDSIMPPFLKLELESLPTEASAFVDLLVFLEATLFIGMRSDLSRTVEYCRQVLLKKSVKYCLMGSYVSFLPLNKEYAFYLQEKCDEKTTGDCDEAFVGFNF